MHANAQTNRARSDRASAAAAETPRSGSDTSAQYLKLLGERVRDARARHGMTRRMLAHDSGVSERYLAQLESGRGNLSIVLLRRVAAAIDVPLTELVSEELPSVEYALVAERQEHAGGSTGTTSRLAIRRTQPRN